MLRGGKKVPGIPSTQVSLEHQTLVRRLLDAAEPASARNGVLRALQPMRSRAAVMRNGE